MSDIADQVQTAVQAGYSPAEIADHLAKMPAYSNQFAQARSAGYSDSEIISHLAGTKLPPPEAPPTLAAQAAHAYGESVAAPLEAAANVGSSMIATPVAGIAGIAQGVKNTFDRAMGNPVGMSAADRVGQVSNALTYSPRTDLGKDTAAVVAKPAEWLGEAGDKAGQVASDITGSPAVGAAVNTGVQAIPAVIMKKAAGADTAAASTGTASTAAQTAAQATAEAAAKNYAVNTAGLDWDSLSSAIKDKLTAVASDAKNLDNLDPQALQREAKLQSLPVPVPATRGQLTRDPIALRNEGNISAGADSAGAPIRDIHLAQNQALLDNLDVLKDKVTGTGATASQATTPQAAGASLQGAARAKLEFQQAKVKQLYQAAQDSGETAQKVDVTPIQDLISKTPDQTHYGYAKSWISQNTENAEVPGPTTATDSLGMQYPVTSKPTLGPRQVSINDLEDLRKAAVAKAMNGGEDAHYAGKLISAIDTATDGAGGDLYKAARAARKQQALEFDDQGAVAKLVDDKSRTDRTTALENTVKSIANGSLEDVQNVKRTLLTGGDESTRAAGKTAWRDLRTSVIQDIKDRATNSVAPNVDGSPNLLPSGLKRAIDSYGPQKLDELFGPGTHRQLMDVLDATQTVKTLPPSRAVGSSTVANAMALLEKGITKIPGGGTIADIARGAAQVRNLGANARAAQAATTTPLNEMVNKTAAANARAANFNKAKPLIPLSQLNNQANQ